MVRHCDDLFLYRDFEEFLVSRIIECFVDFKNLGFKIILAVE